MLPRQGSETAVPAGEHPVHLRMRPSGFAPPIFRVPFGALGCQNGYILAMSSSAALPLPASRPKKRRRLWPWVIGGLVLLLGGGALLASKRGDPPVVVTVEPAVVKTITQLVSATGKIQPEVEVKIAPQVGGEIVALPLRQGAAVKKGDLLLKIKPDNLQFQVAQQEASLASARAMSQDSKARRDKAVDDLKRSTDLHDKKLLNDADFATAQTTLQSAQANYESAKATVGVGVASVTQAQCQASTRWGKSAIYGFYSRGRGIRRYVVLIPLAGDQAAFFFGAGRAAFAPSSIGSSSPVRTAPIKVSMTPGSFSLVPPTIPALPFSNSSGFQPIRTKKTTWPFSSVRHHGRTGSFLSVSTRSPSCFFHLWTTRTWAGSFSSDF